MGFEIVGEITQLETVAVGKRIRERQRLVKTYGKGRWRKLKGIALVRFTKRRNTKSGVALV